MTFTLSRPTSSSHLRASGAPDAIASLASIVRSSVFVTVTGTAIGDAEQRRIIAGYEKLARISAEDPEGRAHEASRRARRDRNRALRSV